jgi:hypothetical protein
MLNYRMVTSFASYFCRSLPLAATMALTLITISAQNVEPAAPTSQSASVTYQVAHDHAIGKGHGELRITDTGIEYRGEGKGEERHSRNWRDDEIKRLSISRHELRVTIYEAAHVPIIPRKAPFTDGKSVSAGTEHDYVFRLREGEITPELVGTLLARFNRPIETSMIPAGETESGRLLFEIPVFHRHRAGGRSGMLRVYEQYVVLNAEDGDDTRFWRYSDIRDIGNLGRYKFEIATWEGQFGVDGKSYVFDLKRPLTEVEYESFWKKVYEQGHRMRLSPAVTPKHQE